MITFDFYTKHRDKIENRQVHLLPLAASALHCFLCSDKVIEATNR